ncbi:Mur ligase [Cokeromyces recurvatus]|uniref:Mur ligase n=1 Tax=Cokeromyces recurvatus TaxID=90255 RepID=UPI00222032BB|nr:Mur ligase [Cokeromyces recurvatus]KAI7898609.1 Mur ligase [Cokeromyces recurvatus]
MNFGLERIQKLLDALDRPDERTKIIHVAGTNGKGSVCAYITSVLLTCGYTIGRFNSPHFIEPRDSINVNGHAVSQKTYDEAMTKVTEINLAGSIGASSFEILVATAFYIFDKSNLDFVVLEVGLGGLLDATNVIQQPVMTIITSIGLDHANILGHTIEEIAIAKAGIMKPGYPVVIAPQDTPAVVDTLIHYAKKISSPYKLVQPAEFISPHVCRLEFDESCYYIYSIQLLGDYQRMNSATAVTALDWMYRKQIIKMNPEQLAIGMKETKWPGRLDWISKEDHLLLKTEFDLDRILVDGAHNPPAAIALREYIDSLDANRVIWIIGCTNGKDIDEMMKQLIRETDIIFAVPFTQPAGMPWIQSTLPVKIKEAAKDKANYIECFSKLEDALQKAGSICDKDNVVVLCGSLYLAADLYRLLL